jgi:hypothetical protein
MEDQVALLEELELEHACVVAQLQMDRHSLGQVRRAMVDMRTALDSLIFL